uniref:Uncharacterized protein n=1 Tax=Glossina brevipalpis TaxID=37001 RepID=A0A1A9X2T1_9MUSC
MSKTTELEEPTPRTTMLNNFVTLKSTLLDSVSALEFSPATVQRNFLIAGNWDSSIRCWEVEQTGINLYGRLIFTALEMDILSFFPDSIVCLRLMLIRTASGPAQADIIRADQP